MRFLEALTACPPGRIDGSVESRDREGDSGAMASHCPTGVRMQNLARLGGSNGRLTTGSLWPADEQAGSREAGDDGRATRIGAKLGGVIRAALVLSAD